MHMLPSLFHIWLFSKYGGLHVRPSGQKQGIRNVISRLSSRILTPSKSIPNQQQVSSKSLLSQKELKTDRCFVIDPENPRCCDCVGKGVGTSFFRIDQNSLLFTPPSF